MKLKSLKANILLYLILFTMIPLVLSTSIILYEMYKEKANSLYHKHLQILKQVIYESDHIVEDIEDIGQYIKEEYSPKKIDFLEGITKTQKNIKTILLLDNNGVLQEFSSAYKTRIFKGFDYSNKDYFQALKNGQKEYWTQVYLSNVTGIPSLSYCVRIDENRIAVLVVSLDSLNRFAGKFKSSNNTAMVSIADKNGIILVNQENQKAVSQRKSIVSTDLYRLYIKNNYSNKQIIFSNLLNKKKIGIFGISKKLHWNIIVKEEYDFIFDTFNRLIFFLISFIIILIIVSIFFSLKLFRSILKPLDTVNSIMDDIAHGNYIKKIPTTKYSELNQLSANFVLMQEKIQNREELNREKDKKIYDSVKMAQMGDMIGNIAHQWRQPLSIISTAASGMQLQKEYDILEDDKFNYYCDLIVENTKYLSETIDIFRNFIKEKKERRVVVLQERIEISLKIVTASLEANHIQLINNVDSSKPIKLEIVAGELSQVIINLINNAKDILLEKKLEDAWIKISLKNEKKFVVISVEDNGGGVPEKIIDRIFDPYFTTKHKSQGTGLGLHMSYKIVVESLGGELKVSNTSDGALFEIILPLDEDLD